MRSNTFIPKSFFYSYFFAAIVTLLPHHLYADSELINEMRIEARKNADSLNDERQRIETRNNNFMRNIRKRSEFIKAACPKVSKYSFTQNFLITLSSRWKASINTLRFIKTEYSTMYGCIAYFDTSNGVKTTREEDVSWFIN